MTAGSETVLDLLDDLVRINSVNPGLDPAGAGETQIAAFVAKWGRHAGLRVEELQGTPWRPSVILRGGRNAGAADYCSAATSTPSAWPEPPAPSRLASTATVSMPAAPTT